MIFKSIAVALVVNQDLRALAIVREGRLAHVRDRNRDCILGNVRRVDPMAVQPYKGARRRRVTFSSDACLESGSLANDGVGRLEGVAYPKGATKTLDSTGAEPISLYEKNALIRATVKLDSKLSPGPAKLSFILSFQACDSRRCLAPDRLKIDHSLELPTPK